MRSRSKLRSRDGGAGRASHVLVASPGHTERSAGYWLYILPGAIGFVAVVLMPFLMNIYYSLTTWSGVGESQFVGLANYSRLVGDSTFWYSFRNSIAFIVAMAIVPTAIGVLLAAILFDFIAPRFGSRVSSIARALFYLPQILPIAVAGVLWKWMYQPQYGIINTLLDRLGLGEWGQNWLGDTDLAIYAVMNVLICAFTNASSALFVSPESNSAAAYFT